MRFCFSALNHIKLDGIDSIWLFFLMRKKLFTNLYKILPNIILKNYLYHKTPNASLVHEPFNGY